MVRRLKDEDGGVAVAETVVKNPAEIAAAAAARSEEIRRATLREDLEQWRRIVIDIADGHEPTGDDLNDIAELTARLKLPEGSLADHVAAVVHDRRLTTETAAAEQRHAKAVERLPELEFDIEAVHQRWRALQFELQQNRSLMSALSDIVTSQAEHRRRNPVVFTEVDQLVERAIYNDARQGCATIQR
jgi:hypothetical protein